MKPIIVVRHLSKQYEIGAHQSSYVTLRDSLVEALRGSLRFALRNGGAPKNTIWALEDVSFDVRPGEVMGIIGRNGAGKSTLLKILSRITEPTCGEVDLYGRVGSLLEIGTGFHPELTGRENIYLNGAILGMKKAEIDRKFDEMVDFSEIEKFIDTPVKHYSSGMYVRLAFAVAAHLEPEILLVDEVLAVGDAPFQRKCMGKMGDVAKQGRTVLFVSHNMAAILSLCQRAALLNSGKLTGQGPVREVVRDYLHSETTAEAIPLEQRPDRSGDGSARILSLQVEDADRQGLIRSGSRLKVTIRYRSEKQVRHPTFLVSINDLMNTGIYLLNSDAAGGLPDVLPAGGTVVCFTDPINITPGRCYLNIALLKGGAMADYIQYAGHFDVEVDDQYGSAKIPPRDWVLCLLRQNWSSEE